MEYWASFKCIQQERKDYYPLIFPPNIELGSVYDIYLYWNIWINRYMSRLLRIYSVSKLVNLFQICLYIHTYNDVYIYIHSCTMNVPSIIFRWCRERIGTSVRRSSRSCGRLAIMLLPPAPLVFYRKVKITWKNLKNHKVLLKDPVGPI